ncbi:hypothetical protein M3J09_000781 [Ascochyta lentis]
MTYHCKRRGSSGYRLPVRLPGHPEPLRAPDDVRTDITIPSNNEELAKVISLYQINSPMWKANPWAAMAAQWSTEYPIIMQSTSARLYNDG